MTFQLAPRLSSDLIELIIGDINAPEDRSSCSLVCREWLPFARDRRRITLLPPKTAEFLDLLQSPTTTLFLTIRHLRIWDPSGLQTHLSMSLFPILPKFTRLLRLDTNFDFPSDFPPLPSLVELSLCGNFTSYASFVRVMAGFPSLRRLTIAGVRWAGSTDPSLKFPTLYLDTLVLYWGASEGVRYPIELLMSSIRTRGVTLHLGRDLRTPESAPRVAFVRAISEYLHCLGDGLRTLRFYPEPKDIKLLSTLDFHLSTGLQHLGIHDPVYYSSSGGITLSPDLTTLLTTMAAHCPLETLTFSVRLRPFKNQVPLSELAELLASSQFASIRTIRFVVSRWDLHNKFGLELSAVMQSSTARVVCIAPTDPYAI
ncbi:hypothetical protein DFH06DRAFT_1166393 [Mycena polygramma]|nr:hypothetical protein DFH06DRAFT_1166393 [Mycena polygramma]